MAKKRSPVFEMASDTYISVSSADIHLHMHQDMDGAFIKGLLFLKWCEPRFLKYIQERGNCNDPHEA